jgi:prepilin-type N-terminal cleavage/methylation domain-containing protein
MSLQTGPFRRGRAPNRAFTLIELILVMTILTAAIGLGGPSLARFFRGRKLDSEGRRLLALTRHGQSRAVSEGVPIELWVDTAQGTFGLEAETSYEEKDPKALDFTLDSDIEIEVVSVDPASGTYAVNTAQSLRRGHTAALGGGASQPLVVSKHPRLPTIRFLPDGSISETSPQVLRLIDRDGASLWLALSRNGVNYEIRTNCIPAGSR